MSERWSEAGHVWERVTRWYRDRDTGALEALTDISTLRRLLDEGELLAVRDARAAGNSWAEIATMLGITRQSAWEKWRDLDDPEPAGGSGVRAQVEDVIARTAAAAARRRGRVSVPDVVGLGWFRTRAVLWEHDLSVTGGDDDTPPDAVVSDQSPESGAQVERGSTVRVWLDRGGGGGVREPRRPVTPPRSGRALRYGDGDGDEERLSALLRPSDPAG